MWHAERLARGKRQILANAGFPAIGTTSACFAYARAVPDAAGVLRASAMLIYSDVICA